MPPAWLGNFKESSRNLQGHEMIGAWLWLIPEPFDL